VPRGKESKTAPLKPQAYKIGRMLCCGFCCGNMSKRDYKVATTDGIELEPLGGEKCEKDKDKDKEKQTNGVTFGEFRPEFHLTTWNCNCNCLGATQKMIKGRAKKSA